MRNRGDGYFAEPLKELGVTLVSAALIVRKQAGSRRMGARLGEEDQPVLGGRREMLFMCSVDIRRVCRHLYISPSLLPWASRIDLSVSCGRLNILSSSLLMAVLSPDGPLQAPPS